jgi:CRP-like cAMP-binding protein
MLLCDEVQLLRKLPYFTEVDTCKLKLLAFASERVTFKAGQRLFTEGDSGDSAYFILSGSVSILCDGPRSSTVKAAGVVEALKINKDYLFRIMDDCPGMTMKVTRALAERLRLTSSELDKVRALQKA